MLQSVLPVTTIELVCDGAIPFTVLCDVCIEQVEADAPNVHSPHMAVDRVCRVRDFENKRCLSVSLKDLL